MHGLIGNPAAWGAMSLGLGAFLWWHEHHWTRFIAWCFALAGACWTVAIPPLFDALAALTTSGAGLTVLGLLSLFVGVSFYLQAVRTHKPNRFARLLKGKPKGGKPGAEVAVFSGGPPRKNRYRRIATPVISVMTGALAVIVVGGWRLLLKHAGTSAAGAVAALAEQSRRVNNGKAAAAIPQSHRPEVYMAAVAALVVIILVMRSIEKRRHGGGKQRGGGTPAIQPARGGGPAFGGQRP